MQTSLDQWDGASQYAAYGDRPSGYQAVPESQFRGSSHAPEDDALELTYAYLGAAEGLLPPTLEEEYWTVMAAVKDARAAARPG